MESEKMGWIGWREKQDGLAGEKKMKWMDGIAGKKIGNEKHGMDWMARQFDEREEFVGSAHGWIQPTTSNQPAH